MRAVSTRDLMAVVHCWMYDVWLSTDCISRSKVVDHLMSWLTTGAVVSIAASTWAVVSIAASTWAVASIAASPCAPEAALATSAASERADGLGSATGFAISGFFSGFFSTFGFFVGDGAIADYRDGGTLR